MKLFKSLRSVFTALVFLLSAVFTGQALAQEAPDEMLKRVSQEILEILQSDKELQKGSPAKVREVVKSKVLPYADFERTTALAVGRHWREATAQQRQQLTDSFHDLLIHTYSGGLSLVADQKLVFKPLRMGPADTDVEVHSHFMRSGRQPIQFSYRLQKKPEGWKVYDISVFGAWLTETYKNTFAAEVSRGGIDGLIRALSEKNRKLAGKAMPSKAQESSSANQNSGT